MDSIPNPKGFSLTIPNGKLYNGDSRRSCARWSPQRTSIPICWSRNYTTRAKLGQLTAQLSRRVPTGAPVSLGATLAASSVWLAGDVMRVNQRTAGDSLTVTTFTRQANGVLWIVANAADLTKTMSIKMGSCATTPIGRGNGVFEYTVDAHTGSVAIGATGGGRWLPRVTVRRRRIAALGLSSPNDQTA